MEDARAVSPPPPPRELPNVKLFRAAAEYSTRHPDKPWVGAFANRHNLDPSTVRQWQREYGFEFRRAATHPEWPDNQIFSPILFEHISFGGEGKFVVAEHVDKAAER
jgi:hypothetical protein